MSEQDNATDFIQSSNKAREYENKKSKIHLDLSIITPMSLI